ncbi:putative transcription factor C2H2 family [Helianthus annuus]|nr:putative transcription factor C2H2 family [Helianthus annuus]KAJ0890152.1 putative transcription factor C2H2 family [Helianthus annuus]KAJ0894919.1 putative transcription factor C2H2 family [Helianthus annuus]
MNPYYYDQQHPILQQQYYYAYAVPAHYTIFYPQPVHYVDDVAILNTMWVNHGQPYFQNQNYVPYQTPPEETSFLNTYDSLTLDETLFMQEIEEEIAALQGVLAAGTSDSEGLSEEEISERLHVYSAQGRMTEVDACSICLCEYEKKEKMGRLECGHRFHAECIRRWLLSKNICPMCRSTALTV